MMDKEAHLLGTRDNALIKKENVYWVYTVTRCQDEFRARHKKDPTCVDNEDTKCEYIYDVDEYGEYMDPECETN